VNIGDFEEELLTSFRHFINTMKSHAEVGKRDDLTYADWFDTFRAYEEVGTEMETEYHGERVLNVHGPLCQLCTSSINVQYNRTGLIGHHNTCGDCQEKFWTSDSNQDVCAGCSLVRNTTENE
jgi:hypothetical protein